MSHVLILGLSVGVVIGKTRLQIELTSYAEDANFVSVGLEY